MRAFYANRSYFFLSSGFSQPDYVQGGNEKIVKKQFRIQMASNSKLNQEAKD
jgi:hypothetical protein